MATTFAELYRRNRRWVGVVAGALLLAWVLRGLDPRRLAQVLASAEIWPLLVLPAVVAVEQALRAFKWRQMLQPMRLVGVWRLFGAIMAGYFANLVTPVRVSPLVRAWLIARLEALSTSTVLATVALDRLIDGFVFLVFAALAVVLARFPDGDGSIRAMLTWGAGSSFVLLAALLTALVWLARRHREGAVPAALSVVARPLPARWRDPLRGAAHRFLDGVVWPAEWWRGALIVATSVAIKIVALSYFVWAGLAFDVMLAPEDYLFLMVFLGFLIILAGTLRIVGGFTAGAVFVLQGFGVDPERALAMALAVQGASMLTVVAIGMAALWLQGLSPMAVARAGAEAARSRGDGP